MSENTGLENISITITNGRQQLFQFHPDKKYFLLFSDFDQSSLSGILKSNSEIQNKNFLSCRLQDISFEDLNLNSCDFLDSSINSSRFIRCVMKGAHFNTCQINDTVFTNCRMEWTNHNETIFRNCTFIDCEFENILIKKCEFIMCEFIGGTTTNKLFESCILFDCKFKSLSLQVQTIKENFGLKKIQFEDVEFRTARRRDEHNIFSLFEIDNGYTLGTDDLLVDFSWSYFVSDMNESSYNVIFKLTETTDWLQYEVSSTLLNRTENFVSFVQFLFDNNEIFFLPIIRLCDFFTEISLYLEEQLNFDQRHILRSFEGLRMSLSRYVESFLHRLNTLVSDANGTVFLDGEGPPEIEFFENVLEHLTSKKLIRIDSVRVRNSPVEIAVTALEGTSIWLLAASVLSLRLRYDFDKISPDTDKAKHATSKALSKQSVELIKVSVTLGPLETKDDDFGIKYLSVFSNGITKKLELGFSAKRALQMHKHILGFHKSTYDGG